MGWTGSYLPSVKTRQQLFEAEVRNNFIGQVIDYAVKGSVIYVAVRDKRSDKIEACVVLTEKRGEWWYMKYMGEEMGPCESQCPLRILRLLSPTESKYANDWRARCYRQFKHAV